VKRPERRMQSTPLLNWEEYLIPAPLSIAIMGELVFISHCDDFSINKNPPKGGYKFIKFPDSFRACLMQVYDSLSHAFNEAHKNMDQICIHMSTVPDYMKAAVNILFNGTDEVIETPLPNQLENIHTIPDECVTLADSVEKKYADVINLIQDLLEACINAEHFYGEEMEKVKMKLEENKLREQSARQLSEQSKKAQQSYEKSVENMEKNQKELTDILVEMQNCKINEIDFDTKIKMLVKGLDAMGRVKEQWEKMVRFFQMVSNIKYADVINLIQDLLEACINAEYFYGEELEKVQMKLEENKLREQSARQLSEQSKKAQQSYEKSVENMEKNQKELTDILVEMQNCKINEIDFDTKIKMLVKGLDAMGRVKEQWEKMVRFFQMVSNIVKTSLSKTMHNFINEKEESFISSRPFCSSKSFLLEMEM
uniref:Uncharacterized protein n=1 Tax=Lates calcarifer TaxID=8187 RepID=A0A4W6FM99_LATCA